MAVIAGLDMAISAGGNPESTGRAFKIFVSADEAAFAASNLKGAEGHIAGNTDWRGVYLGYGHTPNVFPGDDFAFIGSLDGTNGVLGTALCERLRIRAPVEEGQKIEYEVTFGANSSLTAGSAAATDTTNVSAVSAISRDVEFDGTPETDVRSWELDLYLKNVRRFASSSTAGEYRRNTGILAGKWKYGVYTDNIAAVEARLNNFYVMKFNVTASLFWQLTWGHVKNVALDADYEDELNVHAEVSGVFSCSNGTSLGSIIDPGTTQKWPPT